MSYATLMLWAKAVIYLLLEHQFMYERRCMAERGDMMLKTSGAEEFMSVLHRMYNMGTV